MKLVALVSNIFFIIIVVLVFSQLIVLIYKGVGLLTIWILLDYCQMISFLPLHTARCVPYVYEAFRPLLISHMIFNIETDQEAMNNQKNEDYFNLSFKAYNVS